MKAIDRKLLFHLVDIVWSDAKEDQSVPSTAHARELIQKAIERRRGEKYKPICVHPVRYREYYRTDCFKCWQCGIIIT